MTTIRLALVAAAVAASGIHTPADAQGLAPGGARRGQRETSLLFGYGQNHRIPNGMLVRFGLQDLKYRTARFRSPRSLMGYEFSVARQDGDIHQFSVSAIADYRRYFLVRGRTAVGYDLGFGLLHLSKEVSGLATRLNFTEQVGIVLQHSTGSNSALTAEYRFIHVSNAGIKAPDLGINASVFSFGHTWYR